MNDKTAGIVIRNENNGSRELIPELRLHIVKTAITLEMQKVKIFDLFIDQESLLKAGVTAAVLCSMKLDECEEDYIEEAEGMEDAMEEAMKEVMEMDEDEDMDEDVDRELDDLLKHASHLVEKSNRREE